MRSPAVAGMFYAATKEELTQQIKGCFEHKLGPKEKFSSENIVGAIVPHAGYTFSGPVAAHVYKAIQDYDIDTFIIFGPNHTGLGSPISIMTEGEWLTPLGSVEINSDLADEIANNSKDSVADELAHLREHSIEVQLPFLQYIKKNFSFVPIAFMRQDLEVAKNLGEAIAAVCKDKNVMIIASSDFTHYEPKDVAEKKDRKAIEHIINLDPDGFFEEVQENHLSICGYGPILTAMCTLEKLGLKKASLLKYATSGDVRKMPDVVGYASIIFEK